MSQQAKSQTVYLRADRLVNFEERGQAACDIVSNLLFCLLFRFIYPIVPLEVLRTCTSSI